MLIIFIEYCILEFSFFCTGCLFSTKCTVDNAKFNLYWYLILLYNFFHKFLRFFKKYIFFAEYLFINFVVNSMLPTKLLFIEHSVE